MQDSAITKTELQTRLHSLESKVSELEGNLRSGHSANFSEQAAERENDEVMERLEVEALGEVVAIRNALDRIDADTYGICTGCGEDISEKRLEILPYASCCVTCAK
ncbi:MAG: TraR/DksA C4-type zinc finger protein [Sneathiella sp.]|nr:TraR/DksA C4-type zinc finger protein [Sneathiella sp.]